jgi:hypothetical protein
MQKSDLSAGHLAVSISYYPARRQLVVVRFRDTIEVFVVVFCTEVVVVAFT